MIKKESNSSVPTDGLPDVAQKVQKKKPILILFMVGVVIVTGAGMYLHSRSKLKDAQTIEETYTIHSENLIEDKAVALKANNATVEVPKQVSQTTQEITEEQIEFIKQKQKELQLRLAAPLMVVNESVSKGSDKAGSNSPNGSTDANTQFMNQVSMQKRDTANATIIGPLDSIIAEGNLIHATLESATNSDLPGFLRASVSEPVYSEDGSNVLIPRGSRLIGQYKSGMMQGQSRIFIVWTRLITPNGFAINLSSAGVDSLGVAGHGADEIDRHFWARFGTASLLSIIGAGAANVGVSNLPQENSASTYRSAVANSFAQSADESLQQDRNIPPTLKTYQGKPIMVFVAHDLNFQGALKQVKPKINVF